MTNHERLTDALKFVAPHAAAELRRTGRIARDARRDKDAGGLDDPRVPEGLAARLRAEGREDPNQAVRRAEARAKRAARVAARELEDAPSAEELAKIEAYYKERMAQPEAALPAAETPEEEVPFEELDIEALSRARRARNEALRKQALKAEKAAKKEWRAQVGSKDQTGLGWNEYRRTAATRDAPLPDDPEADAAALKEFQERLLESGYKKRADREDRAARGDIEQNNGPKASRDKSDCRPPPTRRR